MPLQQQQIPILLRGLDQKVDPKNAMQGRLTAVENAWQLKTGEYRKRFGWSALSATADSGTISTGQKIAQFKDQLVLQTDDMLYSRSSTSSTWISKGRTSPWYLERFASFSPQTTSANVFGCDSIELGGYVVTVTSNGRYSVIDAATGAIVVDDRFVDSVNTIFSGQRIRVVQVSTYAVIFYLTTAGGLRAARFDPSSPTATMTTYVVGAGNTTFPYFDVIRNASTDEAYVVFATNATTSSALIWTSAMAVKGAPGTVALGLAMDRGVVCLQQDFSDGFFHIARCYSASGTIYNRLVASTLAASATSTVNAAATDSYNLTGFVDHTTNFKYVFYEISNADRFRFDVRRGQVDAGGVVTDGSFVSMGYTIASKVFTYGGERYFLVHSQLSSTGTVIVAVRCSPSVTSGFREGWARFGKGYAMTKDFDSIFGRGGPAQVFAVSATSMLFTYVANRSAGFATGTKTSQEVIRLKARDTSVSRPAEGGGIMLIPGALPQWFDGSALVDAGFHQEPQPPTHVTAAGAIPAGTYLYCCTLEWRDGNGNVYSSAPSSTLTVTLGGASQVTLTMRWAAICNMPGAYLVVWRTKAGGSIFYRSGSAFASVGATGTNTAIDNQTDAQIGANDILYTDGGIFDNQPAPACHAVTAHRGRLFVASSETPAEVWPTKLIVKGEVPAFCDAFIVQVDDLSNPVRALASLDDKLIAVKKTSVYALFGDGPSDTGDGAYDQPQKLSLSIGTTVPDSIAVSVEGAYLKTDKGFYLISRGLSAEYVGPDVEDQNSLSVTGSAVMSAVNQIRWTTSDGTCVVFDTFLRAWYLWTNHAARSCLNYNGTFYHVTSGGVVRGEVAGQFNDGGTAIVSLFKFAPISFAGLGGFARVYRIDVIGEYRGAHDLRLRLYRNFGTTLDETFLATPTANPYRFEAKPRNQKVTAIEPWIDDVLAGAGSEGFRISGLSVTVGIKNGAEPNSSDMTPQ